MSTAGWIKKYGIFIQSRSELEGRGNGINCLMDMVSVWGDEGVLELVVMAECN